MKLRNSFFFSIDDNVFVLHFLVQENAGGARMGAEPGERPAAGALKYVKFMEPSVRAAGRGINPAVERGTLPRADAIQ